MKVQALNLGFGKRSKNNANENNPNVFVRTTFGVAIGSIAGHLSRKYLPMSDEFFFKTSNKDSDEKQSIQKLVNQYIQDYSSAEIQDARMLKTALSDSGVEKIIPELNNKGISELLAEPLIKNIDKNDSQETNSALKVLQADILKDLAVEDKNELLNKFENISDMASNLLLKARNGIIVKENLETYTQSMKGLSHDGNDSIKTIKSKISQDKSKAIKEETSQAFAEMLHLAKISQRPFGLWVVFPAAVVGAVSLSHTINRKIDIENKKGI